MAIKSREEEENPRDEGRGEDGKSEPDAGAYDDSDEDPDDSDEDPTFDVLEETRSSFSRMSLQKKTRPRVSKKMEAGSEEEMEVMGTEAPVPQLDEKDEKCFEKVEGIIKDGKLDKLKVNQCKIYLRKHGLRLTGSKQVLIERIREHLEVVDGGGEKKYPISSFELNCKGDACTGDLVIFEQNVYEMFSIASRSATGPPCGTRIVAGRIVKESYGAAKQQHTFTIEVLWSKGEKPLPPLHPLLIKGRNLYRLKTTRQRWPDEGERRKVLQEKHMRGSFARDSRDQRIQDKEFRKMSVVKSMKVLKCNNISREQENPPQLNTVRPVQNQHHFHDQKSHCSNNFHVLQAQSSDGSQVLKPHNQNAPQVIRPAQNQHHYHNPCNQNAPQIIRAQSPVQPYFHAKQHGCVERRSLNYPSMPGTSPRPQSPVQPYFHAKQHGCVERRSLNYPSMSGTSPRPQEFLGRRVVNYSSMPGSPPNGHHFPRQLCRYYRQGRCYYGDNCKYLHETREVEKWN